MNENYSNGQMGLQQNGYSQKMNQLLGKPYSVFLQNMTHGTAATANLLKEMQNPSPHQTQVRTYFSKSLLGALQEPNV